MLAALETGTLRCSQWAKKHRVLKETGAFSFRDYAFLKRMHDDPHPQIVGAKAAQMGYTETAINRAFHAMDIMKQDILYVFPTEDDANDFSAARFDVAMELSPKLDGMFTDRRNVGLKRAGAVNFYCRTAGSRSKMKGIPAVGLILDEYDEMDPEKVALARKRVTGHLHPWEFNISTPTIPEFGIWAEFEKSEQHYWYVNCVFCGELERLEWETSIEWKGKIPKTARFKCPSCGKPWTREERLASIRQGEWIVTAEGENEKHGYHINQLYSPTQTPYKLVREYLETLDDPVRRQEFWNSNLGLPFVSEGSRLSRQQILACIDINLRTALQSPESTMGVDIAGADRPNWVEISEWRADYKRVIWAGRATWDDLNVKMKQYNVRCCVMDAQPETSKASDFMRRFRGRVYLAWYVEGMQQAFQANEDTGNVNVNRTFMLDRVLDRFRTMRARLPVNLDEMHDVYVAHLCSPTKTYKEDRYGRPVARYVKSGADHFAHCAVYNEIANNLMPTPVSIFDRVLVPTADHVGEFYI